MSRCRSRAWRHEDWADGMQVHSKLATEQLPRMDELLYLLGAAMQQQ